MWIVTLRGAAPLLLVSAGALSPACTARAEDRFAAAFEPPSLRNPWLPPQHADGFSQREFRPRGRPLTIADPSREFSRDEPAQTFGDAAIWKRWREYRTRDRVRVLTLWESPASSFSLQAGKRGDPSLQWTSRLFNHGGATRGLLDRLFSISFGGGRSRDASVPEQPRVATPAR